MSNSKDYDVIVAGSGNAAIVAAIAAHEKGARVLVLEKAPPEWRGGNTFFTSGYFRIAFENAQEIMFRIMPRVSRKEIESYVIADYTKDRYYSDVIRITEGMADPDQLALLVEESLPTVEWMFKKGFEWEPNLRNAVKTGDKFVFADGRVVFASRDGGPGLTDRGFALMDQYGIEYHYNTKVCNLLMNPKGRVTGVVVKTKDGFQEINSKAVILACGGFESNTAMRSQYLGKNWDLCKIRGTPYNTGDMLKVAMEHGAAPVGNWGGCHATFIDAETLQPPPRDMGDLNKRECHPFCIIVNSEGERFLDEGADIGPYTYAKYGKLCLDQPNLTAYQIFDAKVRPFFWEEDYETARSVKANSIRELAENLEIDADRLVRTVEEYNAAASQPNEFDPGKKDGNSTIGIRPAKSNWALKIDTPPYTAYATCCGITFTYGGIDVNRESQVLDTEGEVIPNLYACGEMVGKLFYNNYPGGTGLTRGAVQGRIAGYSAAAGC